MQNGNNRKDRLALAAAVPYPTRPMQTAPPISTVWRPYAEAARALGVRLTTEALGPGRSPKRLDELARRLHKELDQMMQTAFDSLPESGALACAAGCDYCCRTLPITVSPVEIFVLVHRVRDLVATDAALAERVAAAAPLSGPRAAPGAPPTPGSLAPCPLLGSGGLCLVYSSRPLACRGCVSGDASACAACDESRPVPRSTAHQLGAAAVAKGVCDSLDSLGLPSRLVDIRTGLALALGDEGAERRWLRGEDVFAGV